MSHKQLAVVAIVMLIVFGGIVTLYPTQFNPDTQNKAPAPSAPAPAPAAESLSR